ncbi:group-specific protein [Fictibacillus halophilus]|uniref:group-specific protein n=1 Tax=Fictibacillus halophilus TaxID=1610490 RepID=UPI00363FA264
MLSITLDEGELKELYIEEIKKHIEKIEKEKVFWDTNDLKRFTGLSWNTIQAKFFFDERFPKVKLGGKWIFHAEKTRAFLREWFDEQEAS